MIYIPKHFKVEELVDSTTFSSYSTNIIWQKFNPDMLKALDRIREIANCSITINDWVFGGSLQFSGFRPAGCGVGKVLGDHYFWNAFDLHVEKISNKKLYDIALIVSREMQVINVMEDINKTPTWVHIGHRPNLKDLIIV